MKAAALNGGVFVEANDWDCVSVWMPPGKKADNLWTVFQAGFLGVLRKIGLGGCRRMLITYPRQSNAAKKKGLPRSCGGKYWYLFVIGTNPEARGQGLAPQHIRRMQERARQEGSPMFLEASSEKARDVYRKCGFEVVEELVLGRGTHGEGGEKEKGGEGVRLWAMVWTPEGVEEKR